MKKFLLFIMIVFVSGGAYAQYRLEEKTAQINFGLGMSNVGNPYYLGLDYGIHKNISIGGEFTYRHHEYWTGLGYEKNLLGFFVNGNFHFGHALGAPDKFDIYLGLNAGYISWHSEAGYGEGHSNLAAGGQAGLRWYIKENIGLNFEFGGELDFLGGKVGLTVKF